MIGVRILAAAAVWAVASVAVGIIVGRWLRHLDQSSRP